MLGKRVVSAVLTPLLNAKIIDTDGVNLCGFDGVWVLIFSGEREQKFHNRNIRDRNNVHVLPVHECRPDAMGMGCRTISIHNKSSILEMEAQNVNEGEKLNQRTWYFNFTHYFPLLRSHYLPTHHRTISPTSHPVPINLFF